MAILAELFLVLAGYDSGTSQAEKLHPAEAQIFEDAAALGQKAAIVTYTTRGRLDHPVCRVVKRDVAFRYLQALAELEAEIIAQTMLAGEAQQGRQPQQPQNLGDSLWFATKIMAETAGKWTDLFDFAVNMLMKLNEPMNLQASYIAEQILQKASVPGIRDLGTAVLEEIDVYWLGELRKILSEGLECSRFVLDHPRAPDLDLLQDVTGAMRQLIKSADKNLKLQENVLDLVEDNERKLSELVETPLQESQITSVLKDIQLSIHATIRNHILHVPEIEAMLQLLRNVILMGSAVYVNELCEARGDIDEALTNYLEVDKELDSNTLTLAPKLLSVTSSKERRQQHQQPQQQQETAAELLRINITESLSFVFTKEQCAIYINVYLWLSKLVLASDSLGIGKGSTSHAYKLLFNTLWSYYQERIALAFSQLDSAVHDQGGLNVRSRQDKILRTLVSDLLLDSRRFRVKLDSALVHSSDNIEPLAELVTQLRLDSDRHTMDLTPFKAYIEINSDEFIN